ncbi:hypothetical protein PM082_008384 [Marasmius tenuissimus]|nr:hypothetical protein PM082_008384 [Marasmius tenuissimus]
MTRAECVYEVINSSSFPFSPLCTILASPVMVCSEKKKVCELCGEEKSVHGYKRHLTSCQQKKRDAEQNQAFESQRLDNEATISNADTLDSLTLEHEPFDNLHNLEDQFPGIGNQDDLDVLPLPFQNEVIGESEQIEVADDYQASVSPFVHIIETDTASSWDRPATISTDFKPEQDAILIETHPSSWMPPQVVLFKHFLKDYYRPQQVSPSPPQELAMAPWKPFDSQFDFDVAKFALTAHLNKDLTEQLLSLLHHSCKGETTSFTSYQSVQKAWELAGQTVTLFEKVDLPMEVTLSREQKLYDLAVYQRPLLNWTKDLLQDPLLRDSFHWDAQRLYKWNGTSWVRFVREPWTGDRFWELQSSLPSGGKLLCHIFYSDKSKLLSFGTTKGYPIVAQIANIDDGIRNSNTHIGGGRVVGWLDVVVSNWIFQILLIYDQYTQF